MSDNQNFIEQLLIKANPDVDDDALDMLSQDVEPVLFDWIMSNIANKLTDEQLGQFTELAKGDASEEDIYNFLKDAIPDYENFMAKVYDDFEEMYLKNVNHYKKELEK